MSREMRRVPKDWKHPKNENGRFEPLLNGWPGYTIDEWQRDVAEYGEDDVGPRPSSETHMLLDVPSDQRTHFQMYQTTSEGTPISPVMETPEEVARWCADNKVSAFGGMTQTYEWWLDVCGGSAGFGMLLNPETGETRPI